MQAPSTPSTKEQYSRFCSMQMSHIRNTVGSEELHAFAKRNKSFMYSKRERDHSFADMISANKERCYELWCKIQLDEILAKTDASSVLANSSNLFGTDQRRKKNAYYLCSRCGKPKKGHVCKANIAGLNNSTNHGRHDEDHDLDDDDDDEEYKVDPNDPEYEDEEIPEDDEDEYTFKIHQVSSNSISIDNSHIYGGAVRRSVRKRRVPAGFYGSDDDTDEM